MTALLITLSLVLVAVVIVVLVYYLVRIAASLRRTSVLLGKVAFGVRAIETQCSSIGPAVLTINDQLTGVAGALADVTALADAAADPAGSSRGGL
jgi:hypothetical protein